MATDGGAAEDDMNDCSKCCFFRSDAWCYRKLRYVRPDSQVCMQFIGGVTSEEIEELANKLSVLASTPIFTSSSSSGAAAISATEKPKKTKKPDNSPKCFSCGKKLYIERRGRDGYCAECGCYIPQILYDRRFADADKTMNPMSIPQPTPMPTVKCRG